MRALQTPASLDTAAAAPELTREGSEVASVCVCDRMSASAPWRDSEATAGRIKKIIPDRGFGFVRADDGAEAFFHRTEVTLVHLSSLEEGEAVTFDLVDSPKGPRGATSRRAPDRTLVLGAVDHLRPELGRRCAYSACEANRLAPAISGLSRVRQDCDTFVRNAWGRHLRSDVSDAVLEEGGRPPSPLILLCPPDLAPCAGPSPARNTRAAAMTRPRAPMSTGGPVLPDSVVP